jgi:CHAT domain-containing protein
MGRRANALKKSEQTSSTLLAMGNPKLNGETETKVRVTRRDEPLSPLPDAEKEVNALGRLYGPGSRVLIGQQAQEATMKAEASKFKIPALCHACDPG